MTLLPNGDNAYSMRTRNVPENEREFLFRCVNDPRYFLETCTAIRREDGMRIPWTFNRVQQRYFDTIYSYPDIDCAKSEIQNNIVLKSRQYGQSTLELGLIYHAFCFYPGIACKVIAYRGDTAKKLKRIVNLFHSSACAFFEGIGFDPAKYLPVADTDNTLELYCEATGSVIEFTMESAKGAGRSATVNWIYGTEYSEWMHAVDVMAGYAGSLVKDGTARITLDFTGGSVGNAATIEWKTAYNTPSESIFYSHFFGRDDFNYDPMFLENQKKLLRSRFAQEYPATPEEAFLRDDNAIFAIEDIQACHEREPRYLSDFMTQAELKSRAHCHGVDTAEGTPNGDYSVIVTRDVETGLQTCPPMREKCGPRKIAEHAARIEAKYPGLWVIENIGIGAATVERCEDKGLIMYRHPDPKKKLRHCKIGFPTTGPTKRPILEADYDIALSAQAINLPSDNGRCEAQEYCLNSNGKTGAPDTQRADGSKAHDDELIADMLCLQGFLQARTMLEQQRRPAVQALSVGSMRDDMK